jgi:putative ABC transport system permease protein
VTAAGRPAAGRRSRRGEHHGASESLRVRGAVRRALHRLRGLALGETGPGPALALAGVALLTVFVAMAGPRELASQQDQSLRTALAGLPGPDRTVMAGAQWVMSGSTSPLPPAEISQLSAAIARALPRTADSPPGRRWASVSLPGIAVVNPPPRAVLIAPPTMEVVYRNDLAAHARLLSGNLPDAAQATRSGQGPAEVFQVAMSPATASRFGLRLGSVLNLGTRVGGSPDVLLRLSGLISPVRPGSGFWQADPTLPAPLSLIPPQGCRGCPPPHWAGAALIGPAELVPLQQALTGASFEGQWAYPLDLARLTPAQLPPLLSGLAGMATSDGGLSGNTLGAFSPSILTVSSAIATGLSAYAAQQQAAGAVDSLLIADLFVADLILMAICAQLAAVAHRPELTLIRARGGSTRQVAGRQLARAACVCGPAILAGAALAITVVPGSSAASWQLGALAAAAALAIPAAIAAWAHRQAQPGRDSRADLATMRRPRLMLVAEATLVVVAAAALAGLRVRGIARGGGLYTAAPVLVAAAAGLITARLYPVPVRALLRVASARPGPVGFLGLARAARSGLGAVLPALALVISLTLAAFATMVISSISSGQAAAAWQQAGADVMIQTAGNGTVSAAALRAVGSVRGVRRTTAVYTATANGPFGGLLTAGGRGPVNVGLVMVDPVPYAALARQTPWPDFPARLLARGSRSGPAVPILVSAALAARTAPAGATLNVGGITLPVRMAGTIGATPAVTGGGLFVVFPAWTAASYPSIAGPNTMLVTGSGINLRGVRAAAAAAMQVASVTSRTQLLSALVRAPAQLVAERLYLMGVWVAVLLSVLATLFGLTESGRRRTHLVERLTALGMPGRQSRALALTDLLPVLLVAVIGSAASGILLAAIIGPVLDLTVFAGSAGPVPVRPGPGMLLPAAGIVVLAVVMVAVQGAADLRRNVAAALRREEAG